MHSVVRYDEAARAGMAKAARDYLEPFDTNRRVFPSLAAINGNFQLRASTKNQSTLNQLNS